MAWGRVVCVAISVGCFLSAGIAEAQQRLRIGQEVEVQVRNQWIEGMVLRVMPDGQTVQVRIREGGGRPQVGVVPLNQVRLPGGAGANKPGAGAKMPAGGEMRTWSDSTGQFKIEAALVAKEGATVKLRKKDGSEVSVPISRLSRADVEYLATAPNPGAAAGPGSNGGPMFRVNESVEVNFANQWFPAKVLKVDGSKFFIHYDDEDDSWDEWVGLDRIRKRGAANSVANTGGGAPNMAGQPAAAVGSLQIASVSCNLDSAPAGTIEAMDPPKTLAPDPAKLPAPPASNVPLRQMGTFEQLTGLVQASETTLLASISNQPPGKPATTQLVWCDLKTNRVTKDVAIPGGQVLAAGSPANGWLLTHEDRNAERVVVWRWAQADEAPEAAYTLTLQSGDPNPFAKHFDAIHLAGENRAVFETRGGQVVLWNLETRAAEKLWKAGAAALSPGGRYLATYDDKGVAVFDLSSGKQAGYWDVGWLSGVRMGFSPEARHLAITYTDRDVRVLSLATGETRYSGVLAQGAVLGDDALLWASEDYLLIGRENLIDVDAGFVLWKYTSDFLSKGALLKSFAGRMGYFSQDWRARLPTLVTVSIPHEQALAALATADPGQLFGISPGMEVSLQVSVTGPDADRIRAALEKKATANGWKINPAASARLVASITRGPAKSQTFSQGLGTGAGSTTVTYQPLVQTVAVQIDGETSWSRQTETGPGAILVSTNGKSLQELANERASKPDLAFFENITLPKHLVRSKFIGGLGQSELNIQGVTAAQ